MKEDTVEIYSQSVVSLFYSTSNYGLRVLYALLVLITFNIMYSTLESLQYIPVGTGESIMSVRHIMTSN